MSQDSGIGVCLAGPADAKAWDAFVLAHPKGTAYQLWAWPQAVFKAYGFEPVFLMARAGTKICGILSLISMKGLGRRVWLSLPYCDAGGILAQSKGVEKLLWKAARALAKNQSARLEVRSVIPLPDQHRQGAAHPGKVQMRLSLPATISALDASLKSKIRSQARKPLKDGLFFELGGIGLFKAFYSVFEENMRDLGSPVHSRAFLREVIRAYGNRAHVGLVRLPDGRPAAAGIILVHPKVVSIPWASSLRRFNAMNANMLLYRQLLGFAVSQKIPVFDFGRSTPGEGTYRFKSQWGAKPYPLFWTGAERDLTAAVTPQDHSAGPNGLRTAAEGVWSGLPVSLASFAGARIRKYISL